MNKINPRKLINSKWTAITPKEKQKHFLVTKVKFDELGVVSLCLLEAVLTRAQYQIDWHELTNEQKWLFGWR